MTEPGASGAESRARSISAAAEREIRRRKRLTRYYLALLVIPVVALVVTLYTGTLADQSGNAATPDTGLAVNPAPDTLARRISAVEDTVRKLGAAFSAHGRAAPPVDSVLPLFRRTSRQLDSQATELRTLAQGQARLAQRVDSTASEVREVRPAIAQIRGSVADVQTLRRRVDVQSAQLDSVRRSQIVVQRRLETIERRGGGRATPLVPPESETDLSRRVRQLEAGMSALGAQNDSLRRQLTLLRARLVRADSLTTPVRRAPPGAVSRPPRR